MRSPAHTPTPWRMDPAGEMAKGDWLLVATLGQTDSGIQRIRTVGRVFHNGGTDEAKANAAHIVRCVNAHDALVAALEQIAVPIPLSGNYADLLSDLGRRIDMARAALDAARHE